MLFYTAREKHHKRKSHLLYSLTNKYKKPTSLILNQSQTVITFASKFQTLSQPSQSLSRSCSVPGKSIPKVCSVQEETRCQTKHPPQRSREVSSFHLTVVRGTTSAACSSLPLQLHPPFSNILWDEHLVTPSDRAVYFVLPSHSSSSQPHWQSDWVSLTV